MKKRKTTEKLQVTLLESIRITQSHMIKGRFHQREITVTIVYLRT